MIQNEYYPITVGNTWITTYGTDKITNTISKDLGNGEFTSTSSFNNQESVIKIENGNVLTIPLGGEGMQLTLKANMQVGDTWENNSVRNGLNVNEVFTVKELIPKLVVAGNTYTNIVVIENKSSMVIGGNKMPMIVLNSCYAKGVGFILMTNSATPNVPLTELLSYEIK